MLVQARSVHFSPSVTFQISTLAHAGYSRSSTALSICTICPHNQFCLGGDVQPASCPAFTHYTAEGAVANTTCLCNAGYFYASASPYTCGGCYTPKYCPSEQQTPLLVTSLARADAKLQLLF